MDVLDAFVVSLNLDPSNYQREIRRYRDDRRRLADEENRQNRDNETANRRQVDGIRTLRNETAGFLFVLAGANGVKSFAQDIIAGDAATGRLAQNLNIATTELSAWEGAIKRVGGASADIDGALRGMSSAFQSLQLMGTTGHDADFQGLGVTGKDLQDPSDALLKIADASQRMGRPEYNARLSRLGFDQNTINLLAKGRAEVTRMLEEQRKLGVTTDKDAESAQRFQDAWAKVTSSIQGAARPWVEKLADSLASLSGNTDDVKLLGDVAAGGIGAIAIAAATAYWPVVALTGAIASLMATYQNWQKYQSLGPDEKKRYEQQSQSRIDAIGHALSGHADGPHVGEALGIIGEGIWSGMSGRAIDKARNGAQPSGAPAGGNVSSLFGTLEKAYGRDRARGIWAGIGAESNWNPNATNTAGGGQGAYGLGQWRGARLARLRKFAGTNRPTAAQQVAFLMWELNGGDAGGAAVLGSTTADGALGNYVGSFMRPGAGAAGDMRRGRAILGIPAGLTARGGSGGGGATSQTTTVGQVTIYTAATDAKGIAKDFRGALAERGLVVQANTGLQP